MAHLLSAHLGRSISYHDLRQQVVNYLSDSPSLEDGEPICSVNFVPNEDIAAYLHAMSKNGAYGDHLTFFGIACLYKIQFIIMSSLGKNAERTFSFHKDSCLL